jgi:seryl-tRNA synthetase
MCDKLQLDYLKYQNALVAAGLLIRSPVAGVYGLGGVFEDVIERFERYVTRMGTHLNAEVMRFPPVLDRLSYLKSDHLETFPNLIGSVHSFHGGDAEHRELMRRKQRGEDWSEQLVATALVMTPAACYPLYATASGNLPQGGRTVDLRAFVFRHEPSPDPARMQIFRQREYVRLGKPDDALAHRDDWLKRAEAMLRALGLEPRAVAANDPFFGRGGRVMAATQLEQSLKFELVVPIASEEMPTPIVSSNYHRDHFGLAFGIKTADGAPAHTACIGFGLERIALALFRRHGFVPARWPAEVRGILDW